MPHHTPLIATLVAGLSLAFILGAIANRLKASPLVGYLLAGVMIGPFTPGFVADQDIALELSEIGVILLMFGVGMHFSLKDLLSVRAIALPGAVAQIGVATLLGWGLAAWLGWSPGGGLVFGLALSVASTVVLLRALQERRQVQTDRGRIAIGWLIVEDIAMVLALVLLPPVGALLNAAAGEGVQTSLATGDIIRTLALTLAKVALFVGLMLAVGRKVIPWVLHYIAHTGSRELFRLGVLAIGLGIAFGATELFGVSFALGAFFAGMVLAESELSHRAAEESLPLRDAFAVLFFVSVGMLLDPAALIENPLPILAGLLIVIVGKSLAAYAIVRAFGHPHETGTLIAASLAQIGEFSFILAALGVGVGLLPEEGRDLVVSIAILSIILNPIAFLVGERLTPGQGAEPQGAAGGRPSGRRPTGLRHHAILVGFGRVGSVVGRDFQAKGIPFVVIEDDDDRLDALTELGVETVAGNAVLPEVLEAANLRSARLLLVAIPNGFEAGQIVTQARAANPGLRIIARSHTEAETDYLLGRGANRVVMGELEIARGMLEYAADTSPEAQAEA